MEPLNQIDRYPNGRIEIADMKGNQFILQNIYPDDFQFSQFIEAGTKHFIIFGMVGKTYIDGKLCFYPLTVLPDKEAEAAGINNIKTNSSALTISHAMGNLSLQSSANCTVDITDLNGLLLFRVLHFLQILLLQLRFGHGLFMATAHFADGSKYTVKFVN